MIGLTRLAPFVHAIDVLSNLQAFLASGTETDYPPAVTVESIIVFTTQIEVIAAEYGMLHTVLNCQMARQLLESLTNCPALSNFILKLTLDAVTDLERWRFLGLGLNDALLYSVGAEAFFGSDVCQRFGSRRQDMEESLRCCALERYSGCGYHILRVFDRAARAIAWSLSPAHKGKKDNGWTGYRRLINSYLSGNQGPVDFGDWSDREPFYQVIQTDLERWYLIWRNPVIHPQDMVSPQQARQILGDGAALLTRIAERLDEHGNYTPPQP